MKKTFITVAIAAASLMSQHANATDNLVVKTRSNSSKIALDDIKGLKFSGEKMFVYTQSSDTPVEFNLVDIVSLKFAPDGTQGIESTTADKQKINICYSNGVLSAKGVSKAKTAIYSINGQREIAINSWDGSAVSLDNLTNGVYVLTVNNQTFKFVKK